MIFTTAEFAAFFAVVATLFWALRRRTWQNAWLLAASYVFYGWVHPWFCVLLAGSTLLDWSATLAMTRWPGRKNVFLACSLTGQLGLLAFFKYSGFLVDNARALGEKIGLHLPEPALRVVLPVGISFYTFQTMSYTIDVWRGRVAARRNLLDFAAFVSFFPQLVSGPIERAGALLPQMERRRAWDWERFLSAWPLLVTGYYKKLVFADSIAGVVDRVFMVREPSLALLAAGGLAFALQIYADFSGYTDMARGFAKLLGFELMENFRTPYLALTLADFWRRWHISLSTWIRDYLYIPLGGSRAKTALGSLAIMLATMGLSGLWHGAAWNFVVWGLAHGLLLWVTRRLGFDAGWRPRAAWRSLLGWSATFACTAGLFTVFRAPDLGWLAHALATSIGRPRPADAAAAAVIVALLAAYGLPWAVHFGCEKLAPRAPWLLSTWRWVLFGLLLLLAHEGGRAFIYFQF
jgi:alginate O-acetyltransferase complex protein AlgI